MRGKDKLYMHNKGDVIVDQFVIPETQKNININYHSACGKSEDIATYYLKSLKIAEFHKYFVEKYLMEGTPRDLEHLRVSRTPEMN